MSAADARGNVRVVDVHTHDISLNAEADQTPFRIYQVCGKFGNAFVRCDNSRTFTSSS